MNAVNIRPSACDNNNSASPKQMTVEDAFREQMKLELISKAQKPKSQKSFRLIRPDDWKRIDPEMAESEQELAFIKQVLKNGSQRKFHVCRQSVLSALKSLLVKFPNFRDVTTEIMGRYKVSLIGGSSFSLPVINLQGPPGIGKTSYVRAVAMALEQPFHDLKISQMIEKFELSGMSKGWKDARPGKIARILLEEEPEEGQPVILFDELCMAKDTADHSVVHPLYTLFDRDSSEHFRDLFIDMPLNASFVLAFCATNNIEMLRPALRSRLSSFNIEAPSRQEMRLLAQKLYLELLERFNVRSHFPDLLSNAVLLRLADGSIRDMKLNLERAIIRAVGESNGQERFKLSCDHVPDAEAPKRTIGFV